MSSAARPNGQEHLWQSLSTVHDGEADSHELDQVMNAWRDDAEVRRTWHAWQLAADVMRSEALAQPAEHDAAFLVRLRDRLAEEPVPLAPRAMALSGRPSLRWRRVWMPASAVAAGFVVVAGALVVVRNTGPVDAAGPTLARANATDPAAAPLPVSASTIVVRSRELDQYLSAHRQFAQGPAIAAPGGLRAVAVSPDGR